MSKAGALYTCARCGTSKERKGPCLNCVRGAEQLLTATQLGDRIGFKGYGVNRVLTALGWLENPSGHGARDKGGGTLIWPPSILTNQVFINMVEEFIRGPDANAVLKTGDPRRPDMPPAVSPEALPKPVAVEVKPDPPARPAISAESKQVPKPSAAEVETRQSASISDQSQLEILDQPETVLRLVQLVEEARTRLRLVSPYTSLDRLRNLTRSIRAALKRQVSVNLVVREPDLSTRHTAANVEAIQELVTAGAKLFSAKDLHAKIYVSENHAIVTSLNLLDSSFNNSIEIGMWVPKGDRAFTQVTEFLTRELEPHIKSTTPAALLKVGRLR